MGGVGGDVAVPYALLMGRGLTVRGNFMGTRQDVADLVRLVTVGLLPLGAAGGIATKGVFGLEEWEKAFATPAKEGGFGAQVLLAPQGSGEEQASRGERQRVMGSTSSVDYL